MPSKKHLTRGPDSNDYEIVEKALECVQENKEEPLSISQIAQAVNLNESALEDLFSRWAGIHPLQFLQFLTRDYAKQILRQSKNILDTAFDSDASCPGPLHDLFLHCEVMSRGENKKKGPERKIVYGFADSPFGACMIAKTSQGICNLKFLRHHSKSQWADWLAQQWPLADLELNHKEIQTLSDSVFPQDLNTDRTPLHLYIKGTHFQIRVWKALTRIPLGCAVSYQDLAEYIESPRADRAVGTAVGKNPLPFLIPCHRVIRKMGVLGEYGEGLTRKAALIGWEAAQKYLSQKIEPEK